MCLLSTRYAQALRLLTYFALFRVLGPLLVTVLAMVSDATLTLTLTLALALPSSSPSPEPEPEPEL